MPKHEEVLPFCPVCCTNAQTTLELFWLGGTFESLRPIKIPQDIYCSTRGQFVIPPIDETHHDVVFVLNCSEKHHG